MELEIVIDNFQEKIKKENVPSADSNKHLVTHDSIDRKANESVKDSVARKQKRARTIAMKSIRTNTTKTRG